METRIETDLGAFQAEVGPWARENFGPEYPGERLLKGLREEFGELNRSVLKIEQGIEDSEKYADRDDIGEEAEIDAVGDMLVYLADMAERLGVDLGKQQGIRVPPPFEVETVDEALARIDMQLASLSAFTLPNNGVELSEAGYEMIELVFLLDAFCQVKGYDIDECIESAWGEVSKRTFDAEPKL